MSDLCIRRIVVFLSTWKKSGFDFSKMLANHFAALLMDLAHFSLGWSVAWGATTTKHFSTQRMR